MRWKEFAAVIATILVLDFLWLGLVAQPLYISSLKGIGRIEDGKFQPIYWAAILVYLLMSLGICVFILPLAKDDPWYFAAMYGALFGLIVYGVYDFTNLSTLEAWPLQLSLIDITWGTFVLAAGSVAGKLVGDL